MNYIAGLHWYSNSHLRSLKCGCLALYCWPHLKYWKGWNSHLVVGACWRFNQALPAATDFPSFSTKRILHHAISSADSVTLSTAIVGFYACGHNQNQALGPANIIFEGREARKSHGWMHFSLCARGQKGNWSRIVIILTAKMFRYALLCMLMKLDSWVQPSSSSF